jgi:radical SAM protein with 4Fe4S-binding SPASM domain
MSNKYTLVNTVWEFTLDCNLSCIHCGSSAGRKRGDELTTDEAEALCRDLKKTGCLEVTLMGGEPLLRRDFARIASLIRELGMELTVITNGTVYAPETFPMLASLKPKTVAVSLDAATPAIHDRIRGCDGAFDKTRTFMDLAMEAGLPVSVITTVHRMNLKELPAIRDLLLGKGIAWQAQIAGSEGRRFPRELLLDEEEFYSVGMFLASTRENYSITQMPVTGADDLGFNSMMLRNISLAPDWDGCHAGISVLGIQSNGDIKGCLSMTDMSIEGNVRTAGVYDIWNSDSAFAYSRSFAEADAGENCRACPNLKKCKGGCNEMSLMKTGKLHNDPYCFYAIEKRLFADELKKPWTRMKLGLKKRLAELGSGRRP